MHSATQDQAEYWNGEVGERWAANQLALDTIFAPLTEALFAQTALAPGASVLDIGCGAGETALIAARRVGRTGRVVAADISAPLLAVARRRRQAEADESAPIDWVEADVERHAFASATFDHALSRFGVMFFEDSQRAFANVGRSLANGGALTFLCWRSIAENPWVAFPRDIVLRLVPEMEALRPDEPGPFRFAESEPLVAILAAAGFEQIACEPIDRPMTLATAEDGSGEAAASAAADFVVKLGPVSRILRDREPALVEAARSAIRQAFLPKARHGSVRFDAACWLVSARRKGEVPN